MIFDLTKEEKDQFKSIDDGYLKLIENQSEIIEKLRPDDEGPKEPKEPKKWTDAARKKWNTEIDRLYNEWESAGSQEWREAREKYEELLFKHNEARNAYLEKCYKAHFDALGKDTVVILQDAKQTVNEVLENRYQYYQKMQTTGDGAFQAKDVRASEDGLSFVLDSTETIANLRQALRFHLAFLDFSEDPDASAELDNYIIEVVTKSRYTSSTEGTIFGVVKPIHDTTERKSIVTYPKDYVTTVDRVSRLAFSGQLVRPQDADSTALWDVTLDGVKDKVFARVAIDYRELLEGDAIKEMPTLTGDDYNVHDAIITQLTAGNRSMTYDMIYRAMTGKVKGKVTLTDEARKTIDEALSKFRAIISIKYEGKDKDGNDVEIDIEEPLITYTLAKARINGRLVDKAIVIPDDRRFDPPLLRWAKANRNEIDTRDITLLDVPKLNNGAEGSAIKMCLYRRIIKMRNTFERTKGGKWELSENQRTIRYDYIYESIGLNPDELTKYKRNDIKTKIDKCMNYWQNKGFIAGYDHKRDKSSGNTYYAVAVRFVPKEK